MRDDEEGTPLWFTGRFTATEGNAIQDAQVEIWHADSAGFKPELMLDPRPRTDGGTGEEVVYDYVLAKQGQTK